MNVIANTTLSLLEQNGEWIDRYSDYADFITENKDKLDMARKMFREWEPFKAYISATNAKSQRNVVKYSLRYSGQHVAGLDVDLARKTVKITTDSNTAKSNKEAFGCNTVLDKAEWKGEKAREFRRYFREELPKKEKHIEHLFESLILSEMLNTKKENFIGTKPIMIGKTRFSMPTPLGASGNGVKYSAQYGGGIDLLVRTKMNGTRLNIAELKDDNNEKEPPRKVIKQAIKYAVFIQQLLRSKSGDKWWKLFSFNGGLPSKLILNATCLMPSNEKLNDYSFANKRISLTRGDEIELHYLYFKYKKDNNGMYSIVDTTDTSL